jgi:hypothetical protein
MFGSPAAAAEGPVDEAGYGWIEDPQGSQDGCGHDRRAVGRASGEGGRDLEREAQSEDYKKEAWAEDEGE